MQEKYYEICLWHESAKRKIYLVKETACQRVWIKKLFAEEKYPLFKKLCTIRNSHLLQIKETFIENGQCIVIEEFINGETMQEKLYGREKQIVPMLQALAWMDDICDGVFALHAAQIIHRDLNPNNIMITLDGMVKVCDYDISRIYQKEKNRDTEILGTQGYTAPEQFGYGQTNEKSDIYSLGVILNQMLTGNTLERIYPGIPQIREIILRATALEEEERFVDVGAMQKEIRRVHKMLQKRFG